MWLLRFRGESSSPLLHSLVILLDVYLYFVFSILLFGLLELVHDGLGVSIELAAHRDARSGALHAVPGEA